MRIYLMLILEKDATFTIDCNFELSSFEDDILLNCYLPFIKAPSYVLYKYLVSSKNKMAFNEDLINSLNLTEASLLSSRQRLEASGLVNTYRKETEDGVKYIYKLYAPLLPKEFFSNIILVSLLKEEIGERKIQELINKYRVNPASLDGFIDVSSSFRSVFNIEPNLEFYNTLNGEASLLKENEVNSLSSLIDDDEFRKELAYLDIDYKYVASSYDEIKRIAVLYDIKEKKLAELVKSSLNSLNEFNLEAFKDYAKIATKYGIENDDIKYTKSESIGNSTMSKKIAIYESFAPKKFLSFLFKTDNLPKSYLNLIEKIDSDYHLSHSILNVVLDYTFNKCNKSIPEEYVRKVVLSLIGNNISSSQDAVTYLYQHIVNSSKTKKVSKKEEEPSSKNEVEEDNYDLLEGLI